MVWEQQSRNRKHQYVDDEQVFNDGRKLKHRIRGWFYSTQNCAFYAASEIKILTKREGLLCFLPLFSDLKTAAGIALRYNQKTECLAAVFAVPAVVHIMGIDHSVKVGRTL